MPRACPVVFHVTCYDSLIAPAADATGLPVVFHVTCYDSLIAPAADATGLPRGLSRYLLRQPNRSRC
jgi:hypothetical protein